MDVNVNWEELRNKFVVDGWEPARIAGHYGVPRMMLAQTMSAEGWRSLREKHIKELVNSTTQTVGLEGHVDAADQLVAVGKNLAKDLTNPDLDYKVLRSRAETYRTTVEALNIATRLARDVRGIRLGQPSAEDAENRDVAVIYNVKVRHPEPAPMPEVVNE